MRIDDRDMKRFLHTSLFFSIVLLSACQGTQSPTVNDTTAPTLVAQTPAPNAENVAVNSEIVATFSEVIELPNEPSSQYVSLVAANGRTISTNITVNSETLIIQPLEAIPVPTKLTLTLENLPDLAGNPLAKTSWSWFVPASNYGNPVLLGEPSVLTDARLEERPVQVASDAEGNIAVAWLNAGNLSVKSWNGMAWQQLGEDFDFSQNVYAPSIKLIDGQPIVAFQEGRKLSETQNEPNGNILVYGWTGREWQALGQVDTPERDAAAPSLAVTEEGTLTVAYFEFDTVSSNVVVKRLDGSSWQPLGDALDINPDRNAVFPSLVVDEAGNPVVAWYEDRAEDLSRNIYAKRWTGATWEQLGSSLNINSQERADTFSLTIDKTNRPVIAFSEFAQASGSNNIYVKRWNNNSWEQLGAVIDNVEAQRAIYPAVVVDAANQISVAWYEAVCQAVNPCNENDSVYLARWDGAAWQQLGIQDTDAGREAYFPSLSTASGAPVLAWIEGRAREYQILVKRYRAE